MEGLHADAADFSLPREHVLACQDMLHPVIAWVVIYVPCYCETRTRPLGRMLRKLYVFLNPLPSRRLLANIFYGVAICQERRAISGATERATPPSISWSTRCWVSGHGRFCGAARETGRETAQMDGCHRSDYVSDRGFYPHSTLHGIVQDGDPIISASNALSRQQAWHFEPGLPRVPIMV